jgi:uncharacterized protein YggE
MKKLSLFLIGILSLAACSALVQQNTIYLPNVKATVTVPADTVMIRLSVQSTNNNSTLASMENTASLKRTIAALIAIGVNGDDISSDQSTGMSSGQFSNIVCRKVNNNTICKSESSSENVLTSTKIMRLKTTDQNFVDIVLKTAKSAGAVAEIYGYSLSDPSSAEAQARAKAMASAKSIAENMATEAGKNLGKMQRVISHKEYISNSDQHGMVNASSIIDVSYELE